MQLEDVTKNERKRRILQQYNWFALVAYIWAGFMLYAARYFEIASYDYYLVHIYVAWSCGGVFLFHFLVHQKKRISRQFILVYNSLQFCNWIAHFTFATAFGHEIRQTALFYASFVLIFLANAAGFKLCLFYSIIVAIGYVFGCYIGIEMLGQSGSLSHEIYFVFIFFPIALYIAWMAGIFSKNRDEIKLVNKQISEKSEQVEKLASQLSKYLSPQVYNSIFTGQREVRVEATRKRLTVFFSDLVGFTSLTDRMESEALASLLNNYLDEMSTIALKHGGTIDKFIGDAIMIFFGDPESNGEKEDALAAIKMALEMHQQIERLQSTWAEYGVHSPLKIRSGINSGYCTVGNFGTENRLDYTIIGGEVNLAKRLETRANPEQLLISQDTYVLVKDEVECIEREQIQVKGISHPVKTYEVIGLKSDQEEKNLDSSDLLISETSNGFKLEINTSLVSKEKVSKALKKALSELE